MRRPIVNLKLRSRARHAAEDVRRAVWATLKREKAGDPGEINIVFLSNPEIRAYNRKFLSHNYATDVIAFGYQEGAARPRRSKRPGPLDRGAARPRRSKRPGPLDRGAARPRRSKRPGPLDRGGLPFGDILISVDQARKQARELGHTLREELVTLAVHGTLHLLGYDDRRPSDKKRMFRKQSEIVSLIISTA